MFSLELLAYNFHESLELSPLFKHLHREVGESRKPPKEKAEYTKRLEHAAQEVARRQIEVLRESGTSEERAIDFADLSSANDRVFDKCFPLHSEDVNKLALRQRSDTAGKAAGNQRCIFAEVIDKAFYDEMLHQLEVNPESEGQAPAH